MYDVLCRPHLGTPQKGLRDSTPGTRANDHRHGGPSDEDRDAG